MDLKSITREDIRNMTDDEKRDFVRRLIHNEDSQIRAVLFDVDTQQTLSLEEMVEKKGEDEVVEMLVKGLSQHDAMAEAISGQGIAEALARVQSGQGTEEDYRMLSVFEHAVKHSPRHELSGHLTSILLDFICYYQKKHGLDISHVELDNIIGIIHTVSLINTPGLETTKFQNFMPNQLLSITDQIADDMLSSWEATLSTPYSDEMKYLACISLMRKLSAKIHNPLIDAQTLADVLDFDLDEINEIIEREKAMEDGHCDACGGDCGCATCQPATYDARNGSNEETEEPSDENDDMKNLMKGN